MASLDDLKKRISSVKSTQKITKAMKMVAAAKLRRAQENAEKGRPYSDKMNNIILNLSNDDISLSSKSSKYPFTPQKTEITCSATVIGEYCFCFKSSVNFEPLFNNF